MNDEDVEAFDDEPVEQGTIGVGMGGSCPTCRAPVDLGQEFCLECGSPIRFTPRQRRSRPGSSRTTAPAAAAPKRSGFPWIPFLIVLALIGGGVAFALVDGDSSSSSSKKTISDEPALPEITNSVPETTSTTQTVTLQDCDPAQPLDGTQPATTTPGSTTADSATGTTGPVGEQIPSLAPDGAADTTTDPFADPSVPSTTATGDPSSTTVTVDQNGVLCTPTSTQPDATTSPSDTGTSTGTTSPGTSTGGTTTGATSSGDWPSGTEGWTVIVAGYPTQERAAQRAADVQEDGFTDGGVLFSTNFTSLCPGIYVVFSGVFTSEGKAKARLAEMARLPDYAGMYVREIRTSGTPAQGCTTTQ